MGYLIKLHKISKKKGPQSTNRHKKNLEAI